MDIENLLHPIKTAVEEAVTEVKAEAVKDKAALILDARTEITKLKAAAVAATPELVAAAQKAFDDALAALEAVAQAHGV